LKYRITGRSKADGRGVSQSIRRIDADERLLQCAYREPDADREPKADGFIA
jgi:hypothetical protein